MISGIAAILLGACAGALMTWLILRGAARYRPRDYTGLKHHAKFHTFRFSTMILAWLLLIVGFVFFPKFIAQSLRAFSHGVEYVADQMPEQWGPYLEIVMRELGGSWWLQIALLILAVRTAGSLIAMTWRSIR